MVCLALLKAYKFPVATKNMQRFKATSSPQTGLLNKNQPLLHPPKFNIDIKNDNLENVPPFK